jgi:hypothetical protein
MEKHNKHAIQDFLSATSIPILPEDYVLWPVKIISEIPTT